MRPESSEASQTIKVAVWLSVIPNNKYVRGRNKAREEIERFVLSHYGMEQPKTNPNKYVLTIKYRDEAHLEKIIYDIFSEANNIADAKHCFVEASASALDGSERHWS